MFLRLFLYLIFIAGLTFSLSCRNRNNDFITIALSDKFSTLDTLTSQASDAAADRVRTLIFNSLIKKDEKFDYVGDIAQEIKTSDDGKIITFVLRDNIKFHNGKILTSADVKYTFDELFKSNSYKSNAFFETIDKNKVPHITAIETPDPKTVSFTLSRATLKNQLLSNLVTIPIIPEGTGKTASRLGQDRLNLSALTSRRTLSSFRQTRITGKALRKCRRFGLKQ